MLQQLRRARRLRSTAVVLALAALVLTGCSEKMPQDSLKADGPFNRDILRLFWPTLWIAAVVFFLVEGLLLYAYFRFRERGGDERPRQVHGNFRVEVGLAILPTMILAVIGILTVATILDLAKRPANAVTVDVIGHQWWWEYRYPQGFRTATELHMPVGKPVFLRMRSADVIHSFWIPKLNGKRDVIPNRIQTMKLQADRPGTYWGQCVEFCGASHANMRQRAIVQTQADYDAWVAGQMRKAAAPAKGTRAAVGLGVFASRGCEGCHNVRGVSQGRVGPDLTHLASRRLFAGGIFATTPANLAMWIRNPPGEKPGSKMPKLDLTENEIRQLVTYLETLK